MDWKVHFEVQSSYAYHVSCSQPQSLVDNPKGDLQQVLPSADVHDPGSRSLILNEVAGHVGSLALASAATWHSGSGLNLAGFFWIVFWPRPFLAASSSLSHTNEGPFPSQNGAPFVDTGCLVVIRRKLLRDRVTKSKGPPNSSVIRSTCRRIPVGLAGVLQLPHPRLGLEFRKFGRSVAAKGAREGHRPLAGLS